MPSIRCCRASSLRTWRSRASGRPAPTRSTGPGRFRTTTGWAFSVGSRGRLRRRREPLEHAGPVVAGPRAHRRHHQQGLAEPGKADMHVDVAFQKRPPGSPAGRRHIADVATFAWRGMRQAENAPFAAEEVRPKRTLRVWVRTSGVGALKR